jgi:hypothetical protein
MRTLPRLGSELVEQVEMAWGQPHPDWARQRLLVVRLIVQHEHTVAEIMKIAGVSRQTRGWGSREPAPVELGWGALSCGGWGVGGRVPGQAGKRIFSAGARRAGLDQKTHPQDAE